jgi:hypothetical protein
LNGQIALISDLSIFISGLIFSAIPAKTVLMVTVRGGGFQANPFIFTGQQ